MFYKPSIVIGLKNENRSVPPWSRFSRYYLLVTHKYELFITFHSIWHALIIHDYDWSFLIVVSIKNSSFKKGGSWQEKILTREAREYVIREKRAIVLQGIYCCTKNVILILFNTSFQSFLFKSTYGWKCTFLQVVT